MSKDASSPTDIKLHPKPGWNLHKAKEIGIDDFQAKHAPDDHYRTAPLHALWDSKKIHKRGYCHDGRFAMLMDVVNHYDRNFQIRLSEPEKNDHIELEIDLAIASIEV